MTKSHVSLERKLCPVCGTEFDSGGLLINRNLRNTLEKYTTTGYALCDQCDELHKAGFIALVVVSNSGKGDTLPRENANRTGDIMHIRRTVAGGILEGLDTSLAMAFIEVEAANKIKSMMPEEEKSA